MVWLQAFPPAICYFFFNWKFFRCVEAILNIQPLRKWSIVWTFLLNYGIFIECGLLNFHLIVNWIIFLALLLVEQLFLYRQPARKCFLFALLGTQLGLAVNILCRSLIALLLDMPLVAFDNNVTDPGNLKRYPVILGFLIAGVLFLLIAHFDLLKRLELVMKDQKTLVFLLCLLVAMYFYLCMNLMVYYIVENSPIYKVWSMKSSIFVILGECLSVILSIQLGQISVYRAQSQESQEQLAKEQTRELELHTIATIDPLTGCENRLQAKRRLDEALNAGRVFCLAFVDLNGLKPVNDSFGHEKGDKYIDAVAKALGQICKQGDSVFRYGGDEFLVLLFDCTVPEAAGRLQQAQRQLEEERRRQGYPFPMEFSFGVAASGKEEGALSLIKAADARMYEMKQQTASRNVEV